MQYFSQEPQQILLIRSILAVKLENQQSLLKSYAKSKYHDELLKLAKQIARYAKRIPKQTTLKLLRGLEGIATRTYFKPFPSWSTPTFGLGMGGIDDRPRIR